MKILIISVVAAVCCCAGAAEKTLFSENFDGDTSRWKGLGNGWRVEPGVGVGGSKALVWRNPPAGAKAQLAQYHFKEYRPGMKVEVFCKAKILEHGAKPPRAHLSDIEWWDLKGKWAGGGGIGYEVVFKDFPVDAEGWSHVRYTVPYLRSDAARSVFEFFTRQADTGVVAVDDIVIRLVDRRAISMAGTSAYRGRSRDGLIGFSAGLTFDPKVTPLDSLRCRFTYRGADGGERSVFADELNYRWARVELDTSVFAVGRNDVKVTLETSKGQTLDTRMIPFERLGPGAKMPRVYLDGSGRAIVNGKRFFPLGMFWHNRDYREKPAAFPRYVKGPFTCLQTYDHDVTPEMLDRFWEHGLYVIPALNEGFYLVGSMKKKAYNLRKGIKTEADARAMLSDYINRIKDHPAVLAWYTSDEFFPWMAPLLRERAEFIRRVDGGEHPHYGVGNMIDYVPTLIGGFDVFGPDLYCIRTRGQPEALLAPDRGSVWKCVHIAEKMIDACGGNLHLWPVPQAYARGWDLGRGSENWKKYHFPTALEFRAMCWQYIAAGANGLLHYAYGQMLWALEGEEFERAWKTVCDASAEVKAQIPVLLKDEGPEPRDVPENVRARTWRDDEAVYALICNLKPEPISGKVALDCKGAVAGHLTGEGKVKRSPGALAFELGPFAHALVRIPVR